MKQKMISLDDHSFALAAKIKNFSGWIRRMLKLKEQITHQVLKEIILQIGDVTYIQIGLKMEKIQ